MVTLWLGCTVFAAVCTLALLLARAAERRTGLSLHQPLHNHSEYVRYMRDKHDLNAFGFAQQLPRHMGWPSAAGMAASSLPLIGGAVFLLGPAAAAGGPAVIGIGWPLLGLFGLLTASSAAAFASTVPTAGGCYHWAMASGSRRAGLWSGWLHAAGSSLLLATTNLYLADWMSRTVERHFGYTGGAGLFYIILLMLIITQAAAHIRAIRLLGRLMAWTAAAQLAAAAGMIAILASIAWPGIYPFAILAHASPAWTASAPPDGGSSSALLGFLLLQRLFIGIGDGAQAGEETRNPRIALPWSIYLSTAGLAIFGFVLFAFIILHARIGALGLTAMPALGDWLTDIWARWGQPCEALFFAMIVFLTWANGASTLGAGARTLFAMARDESLPFAGKLSGVSALYRSPVMALVITAAGAGTIALLAAAACGAATGGSSLQSQTPQLVLLSIAAMHAAYAIPIGGRLWRTLKESKDSKDSKDSRLRTAGRKRSKTHGPWELGKYAGTVDGVTVCWLAISAISAVCLLKPAALLLAAVCLTRRRRRHRTDASQPAPEVAVQGRRFHALRQTVDGRMYQN